MRPYPLCHGRYQGKTKNGNVTEEIFKLIKDFQIPPYQINNGSCQEFAEQLAGWVRYATLYETGFGAEDIYPAGHRCQDDLTHFFVKVNGKFYDAEAPHGVDKWEQLPIYNQI